MKYDVLEEIYLFNSHNPNVISDISDFINVKIMANKVHKSQYCEYKKGWRAKKEIISKINKFYGKFINVEYAEAFRKLSLNAEERHLEDAYESMRTYNI